MFRQSLAADVKAASTNLGEVLTKAMRAVAKLGHPLLSAVVIHMDDNIAGNGLFTLAQDLRLFRGSDRFLFSVEELRRVHDHWSS